ncbi:MAG: hypothetical protein LBP92_13860 [Deltaproteobacteria bacterium]|jgi:hypothetical protein|nr:hypothetical protein [Deltaproteobacteria bacterium]
MKNIAFLSLLLVFPALFLAGCPPKTPMNRLYDGLTVEQALDLAEQVLARSDPATQITERGPGVQFAERPWRAGIMLSIIEAADGWRITAADEGPGKVRVWAISWLSHIGGRTEVSPPPETPEGIAAQRAHYVSPRLYDLFFARFEFLAGLRDAWEPCAENLGPGTFIGSTGVSDGQNPLCGCGPCS